MAIATSEASHGCIMHPMEIGSKDHLVALTNATVLLLQFTSEELLAARALSDDAGVRVHINDLQNRVDTALEQLRSLND